MMDNEQKQGYDHSEMISSNMHDDFVISGMSGLFPNCNNVNELENNLFKKVRMISDDETRWKHTDEDLPKYTGKIPYLQHFDSTFFGTHNIQVDFMDPQSRLLIQEAFKAVMDAGINPSSLRGTNTGVYVGAIISESAPHFYFEKPANNGFGITGCSTAMFANRISYALGLNGPSLQCNTGVTSSMNSFDLAYKAFKNGDIDAAIIGGSNLCLHPVGSKQSVKMNILSFDGETRPFDNTSNGWIRSEAICCIFLQRKSKAKRIYATVINAQTNMNGFNPNGLIAPSNIMQEKLLQEIYNENNIDANDLGYFEANGNGVPTYDTVECDAIENIICNKRDNTLLIGSIKSNLGHTESASGLCSIIKAIIAMENNLIPPNLNTPTESFCANHQKLQIVTKATKLEKPLIGINSISLSGCNTHILLKQFDNNKVVNKRNSIIPRLIIWASRTEKNANDFLSHIENIPMNDEFLNLIIESQKGGIQGMVFRSYGILQSATNDTKSITLNKHVQHHDGTKRPIVWIFSGMGSQWIGMGRTLMQLPLIRKSIEKSHNILKPFGINLIEILTTDDATTLNNILYSLVGITSIQIALVDLLQDLEIKPDFLIGHSAGELGCAYADGCLTAEQTILASYYRGKISLESEKIDGLMAAVGIGYKDIINRIPQTIDVACNNSSESCTISGPYNDVHEFVQILQAEKIFAKSVPSSRIAFHSRYISHFGPKYLHYLNKIITNPKMRSRKWISSSVPKSKWLKQEYKLCSTEYLTNNMVSSVLFEEATNLVPKNAITIEIAPHGLLLSILKNIFTDGISIALAKRNEKDGILYLLNAIGNIYVNGLEVRVDKLYPEINWPVSRHTPFLSPLISFDTSNEAYTFKFKNLTHGNGLGTFNLTENAYQYLNGHAIDGRVIVPATFYLYCVWKTFASLMGVMDFESIAIEFEHVKFLRATTITNDGDTKLTVIVQKGTSKFEVNESKNLVVSGTISLLTNKTMPAYVPAKNLMDNTVLLSKNDFYKELRIRGYHYRNDFQGIQLFAANGTYAKVHWQRNWVTFLDYLLQIAIVAEDNRHILLPTKIRSLKIYPQHHNTINQDKNYVEISYDQLNNKMNAGGVELNGLGLNAVQRRNSPGQAVLQTYTFISHLNAPILSLENIARSCLQIVLERKTDVMLKIIEVLDLNYESEPFIASFKKAIEDIPLVKSNFTLIHSTRKRFASKIVLNDVTQLYSNEYQGNIAANLTILNDETNIISTAILKELDASPYIISKQSSNIMELNQYIPPGGFVVIANFPSDNITYVLLKRCQVIPTESLAILAINNQDYEFKWINELKNLLKTKQNIILISQCEKYNGLLGLVNCLRKEYEKKNIQCVIINDEQAPKFDLELPLFKDQLSLGLPINILRNGEWGSYRYLKLSEDLPKASHAEHVFATMSQIGDMSSFKWIQGPLTLSEQGVKIAYSSLNFKDIMIATGRLPVSSVVDSRLKENCIFGFEFSGTDTKTGKNIMGWTYQGAISSHLSEPPSLCWEVPKNWSLQEAATIPVVYITVYYAFFLKTDIRRGKSILIHAGSGGVGLAAIRVAQAYNLEVFTTVSTKEKKEYLLKTFPKLNAHNIGNSRDTTFEDMIMERTNGAGVDFVLNSLSEDKLKASIRCLGKRGQFLEIGKYDMSNDNNIGLGTFLSELSFHAVLADNLLDANPSLIQQLKALIIQDIENGIIQPLPMTIFKADQLEQSFRFLMSGKHIGKVLLQIRENIESNKTLPIVVQPQIYFSPDLTYVIAGGLGGFGLELIDWMVLRGARKLVLNSINCLSNGYQKYRIWLWKTYHCKIIVDTSDITTFDGCLQLLTTATTLGPIGGIFNLAVLINDANFENQTSKSYQTSYKPKVIATKNLDELSRKLCAELEHFIVFSSYVSGYGNANQSNYGMANSYMEQIVENRRCQGLPGKVIQWGAIGEVGHMAEEIPLKIDLEIGGIMQQRINSCIKVLDSLIMSSNPIVSSIILAEKKTSSSIAQTADVAISKIMSVKDPQNIPPETTLDNFGMDSLLSIEISQLLERNFNISFNESELRNLTFSKLKTIDQNATNKMTQISDDQNDCMNIAMLIYNNANNSPSEVIFEKLNTATLGNPIIILSGIDGSSSDIWRHFGSALTLPTYLLQFDYNDDTMRNVNEISNFAYMQINNFLKSCNVHKFQIVAYSFGTILAQNIIHLLEKVGFLGSAVYIDGAPDLMENVAIKFQNTYSDIEMQKISIAIALNKLVPNESVQGALNNLHDIYNINEILQYTIDILRMNKVKNGNLIIKWIYSMMTRTSVLLNCETFTTCKIIHSKILLIKPNDLLIKESEELYGLANLTTNLICLEIIKGNHFTILVNEALPILINSFFN